MGSRTWEVRNAIGECADGFLILRRDLWKPTERAEELWFEIDDELDAMEAAEAAGENSRVDAGLERIWKLLARLQSELGE